MRLSVIVFFFFAIVVVLFVVVGDHFLSLLIGSERVVLLVALSLFTSIIFRYSWALLLGVAGGVFLDFFSITQGSVSIAVLLALTITNTLFVHFFTNRSLWTLLLLGGIGTTIAFVAHRFLLFSFDRFIEMLATQLIVHTILFALLYAIVDRFTVHLKPYIILQHQ